MQPERIQAAVRAAKLYYLDDLNQGRIATELGTSRATVSRLLQFAREQGLVKIEINDPLQTDAQLARKLQHRWGLRAVRIVSTGPATGAAKLTLVGRAAAHLLTATVTDDSVIGIGWGKTVHAVAKALPPSAASGVRVVQLKGAPADGEQLSYAAASLQAFGRAFATTPRNFPLPLFFDQAATRLAVEKDGQVAPVLKLARAATVALFTVGTVRDSALLFQLGYFSPEEQRFLQTHAVGDVFSRFIDARGRLVAPRLDARTVGVGLSELKRMPTRILVAAGIAKAAAVLAVLRAGYANVLVVDQDLATELTRLDGQERQRKAVKA